MRKLITCEVTTKGTLILKWISQGKAYSLRVDAQGNKGKRRVEKVKEGITCVRVNTSKMDANPFVKQW